MFLKLIFAVLIFACKADEYLDRAKEILETVPLIDGHNDLPWNIMRNFDGVLEDFDLDTDMCDQYWYPGTDCQTDIPRLTEGMLGAQFWSIYTRCNVQYKNGVAMAVDMIDSTKRMVKKYSDFFQFATSVEEIESAYEQGKLASLLGIEGGHMIGENMGVLRMFYDIGVRYLTLTWNCNTGWADYSDPDGDDLTDPVGGLNDWGRQLVLEMNRLGMLVDLSHVSAETMNAALDVVVAPVIFSHSSAYSICPHRRNVPDDVLLRLPENGGIVMINFYNKFINCTEDNRYEPGFRSANVEQVVDHMEYIRDLIGADYIGVGSDYDGIVYAPDDLEDTSKFPNLIASMLRRGWEEADVEKVMGRNLLRVLGTAEQVRDGLAGQGVNPDETRFPEELPDDSCQPPFDDRYPKEL